MAIILKTTEDKKKLTNAYSAATSLKEFIENHDRNGTKLEISDMFIFEKANSELTVLILNSGEILGTNSKNVKDAISFIYDLGIDSFPVSATVKLLKGNSGRDFIDIEFA